MEIKLGDRVEKLEFESFVEMEEYLKGFHLRAANAVERYIIIESWKFRKTPVVAVKREVCSAPVLRKTEGAIDKIGDGVWGYAGDRWAAYINGEAFPSAQCLSAADFEVK